MFKFVSTSILLLTFLSANAQTYGQIGVTAVKYKDKLSSSNVETSPTALRALFGYKLNPKLSIEGMAAIGLTNDKINGTLANDAKLNIDYLLGIYAKPNTKITPQLEVFLRAGFAQTKATASFSGSSASSIDNSFSYGLGMSYELDKTTFLNLDYMFYLNNNQTSASGFTVALDYQF